jgi:hypothetical protein
MKYWRAKHRRIPRAVWIREFAAEIPAYRLGKTAAEEEERIQTVEERAAQEAFVANETSVTTHSDRVVYQPAKSEVLLRRQKFDCDPVAICEETDEERKEREKRDCYLWDSREGDHTQAPESFCRGS